MGKIYIVKSSEGYYDDYHCWNEKAFLNKDDAETYAKELDKIHNLKPDFITDDFIKVFNQCQSELPDYEQFPEKVTSENIDKFMQWNIEQDNKLNNILFDLMNKQGYCLNKELYDKYQEWEMNSYNSWHDCTIEEIELG